MDNFLAHILVVDDDEGIRSLVKQYLNENYGFVRKLESVRMTSFAPANEETQHISYTKVTE